MSLGMLWFRCLRRVAGHPLFWLGIPVLIYLPTVTGPFTFDDLMLVVRSEDYASGQTPELKLFCFGGTEEDSRKLRDVGTFPWWAPAGRICFFRPLAQCSFYLDMLLFGRNPLGHKLVSLAWFALALFCLHRLCATVCGDSVRAGTAAFFYGISQAVAQPATFVGNRADLLVVVGVSIAATAYWKATLRQRRWLILVAAAGYAFALLSKEMAIGMAGAVVLHEIIARRRRGPAPVSATAVAIVVAVMAVIYMAYFVATRPWQFGLGGDQAPSNVSFLAGAPKAVLLYLAVWVLGFQTDVLMLLKAGPNLVLAIGLLGLCVAVVVARYVARMARKDSGTLFFTLWALSFLLVGLLTSPAPRVLCVATIGWAYLVAGLLTAPAEDRATSPLWLRRWLLTTSGAVNILCGLGTVLTQDRLELQMRANLAEYIAAQPRALQAGDALIVAEAQDPLELVLMPERVQYTTGLSDVSVSFLTPPGAAGCVERQDDHTLIFGSQGADLLDEKLYKLTQGRDEKRRVGQTFATRDFVAEIRDVGGDGRVTSLAFHFHDPLTSERLHFYPPDLAMIAQGDR
ncbi:MAG TPA: hypothetical protein VMV94_07090 [Phycisphaerae bacterium]|nr:hypothetical protein [Phycisphaerae bacterium]